MELDRLEDAVTKYLQSRMNPNLSDRERGDLKGTADVRLWTNAEELIAAARERDALRDALRVETLYTRTSLDATDAKLSSTLEERDALRERLEEQQSSNYELAASVGKLAAHNDALQKRVMELRDEIQVALSWAHTYKSIYDLVGEIQRILNADDRAAITAPDDSTNRETA